VWRFFLGNIYIFVSLMKNIVLVGAGGTWMSGIAGMLYDFGFENLICIDSVQSQLTDSLVQRWINVVIWHWKYDVGVDDAVIYSEATVNSVEVEKAKSFLFDGKKNRFVMNYFEFLGEISKYFKTVGFSGTNGKSSTSSLGIFTAKELLPNFGLGILGALVPDFVNNSYVFNEKIKSDLQNIFQSIFSQKWILNYNLVKKYYFLLEACEYKRHFLNLDLDYVVITNIGLDHTDYFKNKKDYISAFVELVNRVKEKVFVNENFDSWIMDDNHRSKLVFVGENTFEFKSVFGEHWNWNWSFILDLILTLGKWGVDKNKIIEKIQQFKWLWRRMEFLWENRNWAKIFSDYWHVAESIMLGYQALKDKFPDKKLSVIFQPHQMRRVIVGWNDFIEVLDLYDEVLIYDIYAARENLADFESLEQFSDIEWNITKEKIWEVFAKKCGGVYVENEDVILERIGGFGEEFVVVYYSAGDLDYLVRRSLFKY